MLLLLLSASMQHRHRHRHSCPHQRRHGRNIHRRGCPRAAARIPIPARAPPSGRRCFRRVCPFVRPCTSSHAIRTRHRKCYRRPRGTSQRCYCRLPAPQARCLPVRPMHWMMMLGRELAEVGAKNCPPFSLGRTSPMMASIARCRTSAASRRLCGNRPRCNNHLSGKRHGNSTDSCRCWCSSPAVGAHQQQPPETPPRRECPRPGRQHFSPAPRPPLSER